MVLWVVVVDMRHIDMEMVQVAVADNTAVVLVVALVGIRDWVVAALR